MPRVLSNDLKLSVLTFSGVYDLTKQGPSNARSFLLLSPDAVNAEHELTNLMCISLYERYKSHNRKVNYFINKCFRADKKNLTTLALTSATPLNVCDKWLLMVLYLPCTQRQKGCGSKQRKNCRAYRILKIVGGCRACTHSAKYDIKYFLSSYNFSMKNNAILWNVHTALWYFSIPFIHNIMRCLNIVMPWLKFVMP